MAEPRYERGFLSPEQESKAIGLTRGIESLAELVNPVAKNLETGERELVMPQGLSMIGSAAQQLYADPAGTIQKAGEAMSGMADRMLQASTLRPDQMAFVDGEMRQLTPSDVVGEQVASGLDPTIAIAGGAPIAARAAREGIGALAPEPGTVSMSGVKGRTDREPRIEQEDPYDLTPIKNVEDQPFYSAADSWAMENITAEMPVDKLKKKINAAVADPNSPLNELDRDFLLSYADKAKKTTTFTNEQGREITKEVVDPVELKRIVQEESIVPQIKTESINPGRLGPNRQYEDDVQEYKEQYGERYVTSDNFTDKLEVGFIRVTAPTEIIEKKSQEIINPTEPDLIDARTEKQKPLLDRLSEIEESTENLLSRSDHLQRRVDDFVDKYYRDNNILLIDPIEAHVEGLKAAYPFGPDGGPGFDLVYNARNSVNESLKQVKLEKDEILQNLQALNDVYKGTQQHPALSPKSDRTNLLFSRFVDQNATTADGKSVLPSIRLIELQSDYMNDAASGLYSVPEIMPKMFDESSQAYRALQKAAIKEAILNASERGKRAVILPDASASNRPDLYKPERMKSLANLVAKELGEGFEVKKLTVNSSTKYVDPNDVKEPRQFKTDQWAIVFDPKKADKYVDENMKFRYGGIVSLPRQPRGTEGIADVIRKYRREGMMD
jgi:hypothetical protein